MDSETTVRRTLATHGPPDDVLTRNVADPEDGAEMDRGVHFDYRAQEWRDGHDHAHLWSELEPGSPLVFCGADLATCESGRDDLDEPHDDDHAYPLTSGGAGQDES